MSKITYITGGARSGKSNFAEELAKKHGGKVLYVATAIPFDEGMEDRIQKHKKRRPALWGTLEAYKHFDRHLSQVKDGYDILLFDCMTVMVTNLMIEDPTIDWDVVNHEMIDIIEANIHNEVDELIKAVRKFDLDLIIVSNELGMGIVPENRLARVFRDIAGRVNQWLADESDVAFFVVSGQKIKLKE